MYHLLRHQKRILITLGLGVYLLLSGAQLRAQELLVNMPEHDDKFYYLGIGLIYNNSRFQVQHDESFVNNNQVYSVNALNTGGFGLAGIHTLKISNRFEVRAVFPQLLFSYKSLAYDLKAPDPNEEETKFMTKRVESILLGLPVHIKFRSDRIGNFRVYMFGGGKVEYDLASNSSSRRAENLVKLKNFDYGIEAGIGFNFYFPVFILSPEIKISNGLLNIHSRDASLKFSNVIDRLNSRMILFSLIFEG
jgi:hypothetical protein